MVSLSHLSLNHPAHCSYSSPSCIGGQQNISCLQITCYPTSPTLRARISIHPSDLTKPDNALNPDDAARQLITIPEEIPKFSSHFEESNIMGMGVRRNLRKTQNGFMPTTFLDTQNRPTSLRAIPGRISLIRIINRCARLGNLELGQSYHALVIKIGLLGDKFVVTCIVGMYAKCRDVQSARETFDQCPNNLDIVSWNNLIFGYVTNGFADQALGSFMQVWCMENIRPSAYTFSIILGVCGTVLGIIEAKQFHALIVKMEYSSNTEVGNSLLTMYSKFGMMEEVEILFRKLPSRNHVSWTAIITGFYRELFFEKALGQFCFMWHSEVAPNEHTFVVALASSGGMKHSNYGTMLHALTIKNGMASGVFVGTAILDMYTAIGDMRSAEKQFNEMGSLSSNVPWNALIAGNTRNTKNEEALEIFQRMFNIGNLCDQFTYSNVLKAVSSLPSLASGMQIQSLIIKTKHDLNMHVRCSLIEMYAKSGSLANAENIFNKMPMQDVVSWNSMMKAYSQHGYPKKAIFLFNKMIREGLRPTSATFLSVISACSHSGLVQEGHEYFKSMVEDYKIAPGEIHYSSMVDLLGRAGQLDEARDFIYNLPIEPSASIWRPLLAASRCHGNLEMAEFAARYILKEDPRDPTVYVTLSNMYAELGRWSDVEKQRKLMKLKDLKKEPGSSWVEVNNRLYYFYSRDIKRIKMPEVYSKLEELVRQIKSIGYVPDTNLVLHQGDEASKKEHILLHSEKLALCFGLVNSSSSSKKPIRIFKNLRICSDCHTAMKYISVVTEREIILRDNYRFHCFKQGQCSCGDYW